MKFPLSKLFGKDRPKKPDAVPEGAFSKDSIARYLPANPIVIEAGAHIGKDTEEMARLWPDGHIHAFEPFPDVFEKLQKRVKGLKNVTCYSMALADQTGTVSFNVSSGKSNASSSLLQPKQHLEQHPDVFFNERIEVEATRIDDWAVRFNVPKVDFLWLDLQGYELFALKSGENVLKTVSLIYTEVFLKESYAGAPLYPEVKLWMESRGFRVEWEGLPWPDSGNVLFVRQ
ncbi:MAG: FkbM family methyltransferase [Verrucomicrobiota bacterium]|nr:FkbM family methyltransferase [Verrucomicrobiota bacterium]